MIYIKNIFIVIALLLCIPGDLFALDFTAGATAANVDLARSRGVAVGDFNGDGNIDMYVGNTNFQQNQVWFSNGLGDYTTLHIIGDTGSTHAVLAKDFDGDGDLDLYAINASAASQNKLWMNNGLGVFTNADIAGDVNSAYGGDAGDIDGDGDLDLYVATVGPASQNKLWINNGSGSFTANDIVGDTGNATDAIFVDVDGDEDMDLYVGFFGQNKLWINNGSGSFTANDIVGDTGNTYGVTAGDVDGDGDMDLYGARQSGQNKLWINNGSGSFTNADIIGDTGISQSAAFGDLDFDGDLDLYVVNNGTNRLWINNGSGSFTSDDIPGDTGDSQSVALFDYNNNGTIDIFIAVNATPNKFWINNEIPPIVTPPASSSRSASGVKRICADPTALNYDDTRFGRHTPSWCRYGSAVDSDIPATNPFGGVLCSEELRIHDNMKQGDVNGIYSSYNKGIVTEVSLLQSHINRLLTDDYSQAAGPVDIWFGSQTKRGVERLQIKLNQLQGDRTPLVVDGIVGTYTKAAINMSC